MDEVREIPNEVQEIPMNDFSKYYEESPSKNRFYVDDSESYYPEFYERQAYISDSEFVTINEFPESEAHYIDKEPFPDSDIYYTAEETFPESDIYYTAEETFTDSDVFYTPGEVSQGISDMQCTNSDSSLPRIYFDDKDKLQIANVKENNNKYVDDHSLESKANPRMQNNNEIYIPRKSSSPKIISSPEKYNESSDLILEEIGVDLQEKPVEEYISSDLILDEREIIYLPEKAIEAEHIPEYILEEDRVTLPENTYKTEKILDSNQEESGLHLPDKSYEADNSSDFILEEVDVVDLPVNFYEVENSSDFIEMEGDIDRTEKASVVENSSDSIEEEGLPFDPLDNNHEVENSSKPNEAETNELSDKVTELSDEKGETQAETVANEQSETIEADGQEIKTANEKETDTENDKQIDTENDKETDTENINSPFFEAFSSDQHGNESDNIGAGTDSFGEMLPGSGNGNNLPEISQQRFSSNETVNTEIAIFAAIVGTFLLVLITILCVAFQSKHRRQKRRSMEMLEMYGHSFNNLN